MIATSDFKKLTSFGEWYRTEIALNGYMIHKPMKDMVLTYLNKEENL